jgi:hypothetical protein
VGLEIAAEAELSTATVVGVVGPDHVSGDGVAQPVDVIAMAHLLRNSSAWSLGHSACEPVRSLSVPPVGCRWTHVEITRRRSRLDR